MSTATLPGISLSELLERAPLFTRTDRKYVLPAGAVSAVLDRLPSGVRVLDIDGQRSLRYRSVYFDTADLACYRAAAHRRRRRYKVRVRSYLDTGAHFAEVKIRGRRGITVKERTPVGAGFALGRTGLAFAGASLAAAGFRGDDLSLTPALVTGYRRTTLFVPSTGSRVTVDTGLVWSLPDGSAAHDVDCAVVETKSARTAGDVDRLLWSLRHRPVPISKYATGLAVLRPDLPATRWRPVLRRHVLTDHAWENRP